MFAIAILFIVDRATGGDDGGWWIVAVLEAWAVAWSLHAFGVAMAYSKRGPSTD